MPNEVYCCGIIGCGTQFVTPYIEVANAWVDENRWHFSCLVHVRTEI